MKYCNYCKEEVKSRGEVGCSSSCGRNCQDCCSKCNRHGLLAGPLAVIKGYNRNPSSLMQRMANEVMERAREVDRGDRKDYTMCIEQSDVNDPKYGYTQYLQYTGNGKYTTYTVPK